MYVLISLIVFTDKYLGHVWKFYTNGISLHFNYIQIQNNNQIHNNNQIQNNKPLGQLSDS